jgi:hypothetical protein
MERILILQRLDAVSRPTILQYGYLEAVQIIGA